MKRTSEFNHQNSLYLITTPIGNLSDISKRAIETLNLVDYLFCEDTRVTMKLLSFYGIENKILDSYHDHSTLDKENKIISLLKEGYNVGLVSDAGTPIISDPGFEIVKRCINEEINVVPVPGVSAQVTALTLSTLAPKPYLFYGFLDHNDDKKKKELNELKNYPFTILFYESPVRIRRTIKLLYDVFGERDASLSRELTKMYEETIYFKLSEYDLIPENLKGEMVLSVSGKVNEEIDILNVNYLEEIDKMVNDGYKAKEACKIVSAKYNLKSSDIYNEYQRSK